MNIISTIYANSQNPLCNSVAPWHISYHLYHVWDLTRHRRNSLRKVNSWPIDSAELWLQCS